MSELRPCPFCGGEAIGFEWSEYDEWEYGELPSPDAFCDVKVNHKDDCPLKVGEFQMWIAQDEKEAAELWNRRTNECGRDALLKLADELDAQQSNKGIRMPGPYMEPCEAARRIREACGVFE